MDPSRPGSHDSVAMLVSGGVDSAVGVHLLVEQGVRPHLFYIKIGPEREEEWNCTSEEDIEICQWLAKRYGLPLEVVDLHQQYWQQVVGYFVEKSRQGLTPNPDVLCNKLIKFGCFEERVGKDFQFVATGHYATTDLIDGRVWLATANDPVKDQTDFLCQLSYRQLAKSLFPIGHLRKDQVRQIACHERLLNARRKDSQGICFLGDINFREYVKAQLGEHPGPVLELETGRQIGEHRGLWFYTIGQRKGLGFGGGPWFVVKKSPQQNIIYVSHGYHPEAVYHNTLHTTDFHFITANPWPDAKAPRPITFKIRHTPEFSTGTIERDDDGRWTVHSNTPLHGVAPGQFCVVYDPQHHLCLGSGEIA